MTEESRKEKRTSWRKELREWTLTLGSALLLSFLIQNYAFAQVEVEQHSMDTTLSEGQRLVENRLLYRFADPKRGDIVIINGPETDKRLVKRLIGLPGETVDIREGAVWINGQRLDEAYTKGSTFPGTVKMPLQVPEGSYFVLGDNREYSLDSRHLGTVSMSSLEGKAVLRLWPFDQIRTFD